MIAVDLAALKAAGPAVGSTLNDAFVASVTGGLRRYHELHGAPVTQLRVTMPVSTRREDDPVGGNRFTLERFTLPAGEADPGTRVRMTGWQCRAARYEEALPLSDAVAGVLNLLPVRGGRGDAQARGLRGQRRARGPGAALPGRRPHQRAATPSAPPPGRRST